MRRRARRKRTTERAMPAAWMSFWMTITCIVRYANVSAHIKITQLQNIASMVRILDAASPAEQ